MQKFRLVHYFDVWGNAKDGYEVNNMAEIAVLKFDETWPTNRAVFDRLKKIGFLKKTTRVNSVRFDEAVDMYEIFDRKGAPFCFLEGADDTAECYHMEPTSMYGLMTYKKVIDEEEGNADGESVEQASKARLKTT